MAHGPTLRQLRSLGLDWPHSSSRDPDEAIDIEGELTSLEITVAEGRPGYDAELAQVQHITRRLDEAGIAWRSPRITDVVREISASAADPVQGVLDCPDDLAPRLAYAKTLREDDPRSLFIRLQCEAFCLPEWCPRRALLEARAASLRAAHYRTWGRMPDPSWDDRVPYTGPPVWFSRGFVEGVELASASASAIGILREDPIRELRWVGDAGPLASVDLARVRSLWLEGGPLRVDRHPTWLRAIEQLTLANVVDAREAVRVLAVSREPLLPSLEKLSVHPTLLDRETLSALSRSALAKRLAALTLVATEVDHVRALAEGPYPELERLELEGGAGPGTSASHGRPGALSGLSALTAAKLTKLGLRRFAMTESDGRALAALSVPHLSSFVLQGAEVDAAALDALASAKWLPQIETMWLAATFRGRDVAPLLARFGAPLRSLALMSDDLEGVGASLASSPGARRLVALRTHRSMPAPDLAAILDAAPELRAVTLLSGRAPARESGAAFRELTERLELAGFTALEHVPGTWARRISA